MLRSRVAILIGFISAGGVACGAQGANLESPPVLDRPASDSQSTNSNSESASAQPSQESSNRREPVKLQYVPSGLKVQGGGPAVTDIDDGLRMWQLRLGSVPLEEDVYAEDYRGIVVTHLRSDTPLTVSDDPWTGPEGLGAQTQDPGAQSSDITVNGRDARMVSFNRANDTQTVIAWQASDRVRISITTFGLTDSEARKIADGTEVEQ